jgi:excisionase family DNA binding protein
MTTPEIDQERLLTSHEAGKLLQVNASSVNKWVNEGRIPAFRTPGGHRRIRVGDLVSFLDAHKMPIPRELGGALPKRRLLIVDDNEKYLAALRRSFKPYASRVDLQTLTNGIDALVQIGAFKPHLVILDVFMPDVDGLEICRRLKAAAATRSIEIIIASAQLTQDIEHNADKAGARRCLRKPFDVETVLLDLGVISKQPTIRT